MKKNTLLFLFILLTSLLQSQTVVWESDSEDYATDWSVLDNDGDGIDWGVYAGGAESFGFSPGALFYSQSWNSDTGLPLTPDNILFSTTFTIPGTATSINFKMKVAASDSGFPAEKFSVYVYDDVIGASFDDLIYEETLTTGGDGTAKDIMAPIPVSFTGKTVGIIVRHHDCTDQNQLLADDFEVSYGTLSTEDNELSLINVYPNPVKNMVTIDTNLKIDNVSVFNQLGQNVMHIRGENIINKKVDLASLTTGLYFMNIGAEGKNQSIKIIKE